MATTRPRPHRAAGQGCSQSNSATIQARRRNPSRARRMCPVPTAEELAVCIPIHDKGGAESYDVLTPPMTTLYSQVWWAPLAPVDLPSKMVEKYANSSMAIVGWEIDQVQLTPNGEVSVPISASYNHHYIAQISGAGSSFEKVMLSGPDDPLAAQVHLRTRTCAGVRRTRATACVHVRVCAARASRPDSMGAAALCCGGSARIRKCERRRVSEDNAWLPSRVCLSGEFSNAVPSHTNADRHVEPRPHGHIGPFASSFRARTSAEIIAGPSECFIQWTTRVPPHHAGD